MWGACPPLNMLDKKLKSSALAKNNWPIKEYSGIPLVFSPLLLEIPVLTHAFTTRLGGKSKPPLDSFNLGRHLADPLIKEDAVLNRTLLCQAMAVDVNKLVVPGQIHSTNITWVSKKESYANFDGLATLVPKMPLMLHYADCVPIILFERKLKAVSVLHAGWRGTADGIATKAVAFLMESLDAKPENMVAAIGPAIGSCCYPTGKDVAQRLLQLVKNQDDLLIWQDGIPHPDLKAINAWQLLQLGVNQVDVSSFCTACHPKLFYSHRQSNGNTGRQGALACLN